MVTLVCRTPARNLTAQQNITWSGHCPQFQTEVLPALKPNTLKTSFFELLPALSWGGGGLHDRLWVVCYRGSMLWGWSWDSIPEVPSSAFAFHDPGLLKTGQEGQAQAGARPAGDPRGTGAPQPSEMHVAREPFSQGGRSQSGHCFWAHGLASQKGGLWSLCSCCRLSSQMGRQHRAWRGLAGHLEQRCSRRVRVGALEG